VSCILIGDDDSSRSRNVRVKSPFTLPLILKLHGHDAFYVTGIVKIMVKLR